MACAPGTVARTLVACLATAVLASATAGAQDRREPPTEAVDFYRSGREHFTAGRYREAIDDLERALTLDPGSPTLLYNLGRVYELLGELDQAIEYYAQYVRLMPESESEERARIEETLQRLRGARDQVSQSPPHEGPPPDFDLGNEPRYVTERGVADLPFWIAAGSSAVLLVGGGVIGLVALEHEGRAETFIVGSDGTLRERDDIANRADDLAVAADVLLLGAVAGAITAGLLYGLRTRTTEHLPDHQEVEPFAATDGTSATVGVRGRL